MRSYVSILALIAIIAGCGRADPPCPPRSREVYLQEADEAMTRKAQRLEREGNLNSGRAITFNCGYDPKPDGSYRTVDQVVLYWGDVLWCITDMVEARGIPLTQCLDAAARSHFTGKLLGGDMSTDVMLQVASKVTCLELSREVDIEAEKHGLERTGPGDWVPIIIWAVINAADAALAPTTAPAMFLIKPGQGSGEQACVDVDAEKKCAAEDGCPDRPAGAEPIDGGASSGAGGVIPPGTTPGLPGAGSGDYP